MGAKTVKIIASLSCALLPLTFAQAQAAPAAKSQASAQAGVESADATMTNQDWWPDRLDLSPLRQQSPSSNPLGNDFNYAAAFATLDLEAVKADIRKVLTTSQSWWPADYGNYGPFFIRMAWHSAGTYRVTDGRGGAVGGQQRFEPLNSWPDNVSLDKARRLVWPIKQKYGSKISWGDLMALSGNVALESMGFKTIGFAGGRRDDWEADRVYWGPEQKFLDDKRYSGDRQLSRPLAAVQMGLIYVNPEGPNGNPDPIAAARDIRETFGRMAMDDEETVALIAGGHTFGKAHGAHAPSGCVGAAPAAGAVEQQGFGWKNSCGKGNAEDTVSSGLEGAWSSNPIAFTTQYLDNLFTFDWVKTKSPAGAIQWVPSDKNTTSLVPDAHVAGLTHAPIMFTTDLSLKEDPAYRVIAMRFHDHPDQFADAFARAWFKLIHRDMGPRSHYLGPQVPAQQFIWQDPLPQAAAASINTDDATALKVRVLASGLTVSQLVRTAWASAASYRGTDMRGGANGARLRLEPQIHWLANNPAELATVLARLDAMRADFNRRAPGGRQISLADMIVLAGNAGVEQAARAAGADLSLPFKPGRVDATQTQTDAASFAPLEPTADGFRNYYSTVNTRSPAEMLVERATLLELTVPEMTVLVGGMRALNANSGQSADGVLTTRPGVLTNDFFVNLLDMRTQWAKSDRELGKYIGSDRVSGQRKWSATPVDLVFGSNSELRAVAEVYASDDASRKFIDDFGRAWTKVMDLDRR
ncbi:catalase/peroxidase HPI [Sphingobium xenophagum]|jgi:catalase-peroxidase|uniref:catalase/peroxidase HPI n=1 Tax=Sphingomonadales TaxID=204457 RepID=UPI001C0CCF68|nr:catalase/peroxidase HPI [Sphingobium xenophagum]QWT15528.1 catalase/peroxidase HPI [Sphingobium xenophagum]|tara:strand:+ start:37478 stop:39739 length:2262 start_codon:yes stop_codon:yes gene_type:complete